VCLRPIAVPPRGWAPPVLIQFFGISAAPKREFHLASRRWAQIETTSPAVGRIGRSFPCEPPSASASQLRVDRRPRAPGQRGDRQCGRLGTGLRRSFAGRAEIASDCEIRRPERQAMITVVVITTVVAGVQGLPVCGAGFRGPIFRGQSRTRRGALGPCPRLPPNRCLDAPPHGGFHSTNHGRGCRAAKSSARHSAAREPSCRASSAKPDPPLRSSRRNIGIPIGRRRGPACAIVERGAGVG
jgi:hypothetical protein